MNNETTTKPRILAADDSKVMRRAMSKILSTDYDLIEVENGEDAWTVLLNDESIQLVFTDLSMPFLDGFGLLERIRTADNARINELPVIILTGKEDDDETKQEALDKGANDFITKPFDSVQLRARAKAHITHKQTSAKLTETSHKLENQSTVDETTGLGGQGYFCKVGEETIAYTKRNGMQFITTLMDIDNFNHLVARHGKKVMDCILQKLGEKLTAVVRQQDTIARIDVSKFAFILKETSIDEAHLLLERIRKEIQATLYKLSEGEKIKLTVSVGLYEPDLNTEQSFKEIIKETGKHLEQAISKGGNCIISHSNNIVAVDATHEDVDFHEILNKLKENNADGILAKVDSILYQLKPLLKYIADNERKKLQILLREISRK